MLCAVCLFGALPSRHLYFVEFNFTSQLEPMRSISVWEPTEPWNWFYWNGYPEFGSFGADRCLDTATGVDGLCRCAYLRCLSLFPLSDLFSASLLLYLVCAHTSLLLFLMTSSMHRSTHVLCGVVRRWRQLQQPVHNG